MVALLVGAAVLAAVGALLIVVGVRAVVAQAGFNRRALQTTGHVVAWKAERIRVGSSIYKTVHFPMVEYRTPTGAVRRRAAPGASVQGPLGMPMALLYDPEEPGSVSFTGKRGQLGLAKALVVGGTFLVGSAALLVALGLAVVGP